MHFLYLVLLFVCIFVLAYTPGSCVHLSKGKCQWEPKLSPRADNVQETKLDNSWWKSVPGEEFVNKFHQAVENSLKNRNQHFFIMFYVPYCGFSQMAKGEFASAAQAMAFSKNSKDQNIEFWAVDCFATPEVCYKYGIRGLPTFLYFDNKARAHREYEDFNVKHHFIRYLRSKLLEQN